MFEPEFMVVVLPQPFEGLTLDEIGQTLKKIADYLSEVASKGYELAEDGVDLSNGFPAISLTKQE
jgi:hypothetical protein